MFKRPTKINNELSNVISALLIPKLDNILLELKPKCGIYQISPFYLTSNENLIIKQKVCRYKMHQLLKQKLYNLKHREDIDDYTFKLQDKISTYCPFDLFSKYLLRVNKAVSDINKTPQNNIKFSINGKQV